MSPDELRILNEDVDGEFDESFIRKISKIDFGKVIDTYKIPISLGLVGAILVGFGAFIYKQGSFGTNDTVEVLESASSTENKEIVVEVAGAVEKPGVYQLKQEARVEDLLIAGGGISVDADRVWIERMVNRAAKLADGQKLYIPVASEQTEVLSANSLQGDKTISQGQGSAYNDLININSATLKELDSLPGIGPVYGQNIIEHRPYSTVEELLNRGVLKKSTYEKIKDKITVF